MTTKENIKAILSCNFSGFKDEHIETATNRIMETVNTTCPNCDSGYAQGYSDGYLKGKDERPHGKWIAKDDSWVCSECNEENAYAYDNNIHKFTDNFCPNCGARMEADNETDN